jgi:hypothetical protein
MRRVFSASSAPGRPLPPEGRKSTVPRKTTSLFFIFNRAAQQQNGR